MANHVDRAMGIVLAALVRETYDQERLLLW